MKLKLLPLLSCAFCAVAMAQTGFQKNTERNLRCEDRGDSTQFHACVVREQTIPFSGSLHVNSGENGGVAVKGWNRPDVLVRSKIETWADSASDGQGILSAVQIHASSGEISASGPQNRGEAGWSVSYEIFAPHRANLDLEANNGGVHVSDIAGNMNLHTVNGGLHLARLAGEVTGATVNGGVHVELAGDHWEGSGLNVTSTNGGVHLAVPASYSAQIEGSTVNGHVHSDFNELATGEKGNHASPQVVRAAIGHGGATIHVATSNGGLKIERL